MSKKKAIVIVSKDYNVKSLDYYYKIKTENDLIIVSPIFKDSNELLLRYPKIKLIEDKEILSKDEFPLINKTNRPNWYYQQFLKYKIVINLDYDLVHIVDGDSFVDKKLLFVHDTLHYTNKNIEINYRNFINKTNPQHDIQRKNFITNQICFSKKELLLLLDSISVGHKHWINFFCGILIKNPNCWFSEYQLYANFILRSSNDKIKVKKIKVFRRFDLLHYDFEKGLNKYSLISYENNHKSGLLRRIRAYFFYYFNFNLG